MKRIAYIVATVAALIIAGTSTAYAEAKTHSVVDSTATTHVRKFDRGLTNYSFIPKNEWICGITASYTGYNSDENDLLLLVKDFNFTGSLFGVHPYVGYFVADNHCVGVKLGYSATKANLGNFSLDLIDGMSLSLSDLEYNAQFDSRWSIGCIQRNKSNVSKWCKSLFAWHTREWLARYQNRIERDSIGTCSRYIGIYHG